MHQTDQIRARNPIPAFLYERGFMLRKTTDGWRGPCPVHKGDNQGAFHVLADGESAYCHSRCQRHYDVIALVQALDGLSFPAACERLGSPALPGDYPSARMRRLVRSVEEQERLRESARIKSSLLQFRETTLRRFDWPKGTIIRESPVPLPLANNARDWRLFLRSMHPPGSVIWIGEPWQSGTEHGEGHFLQVENWLSHPGDKPPGPHTCPDRFQPGTVSRSASAVTASPYLVMEADTALGFKPVTTADVAENVRLNLAIANWLRTECGWTLRAVILTGGKSAHCWFDKPPADHIDQLRSLAPGLGIDTAVFGAAHPCRMPGVLHESTGIRSELIFLNPLKVESPCNASSPLL